MSTPRAQAAYIESVDWLLPDEESMCKMAREYARVLKSRTVSAEALSLHGCGTPPLARVILLLYFAFALGYNFGYGNALADADGDMGGLQSRQRRDGDVHNFFPRKG